MKGAGLGKLRRTGKFFFDLIGTESIRKNVLQALPFWIASLMTGLIAVGYTKLFAYSEVIRQNILHWHQWLIFIIAPVSFFLAWLVVQVFAPNARGSGIPQVMAAIAMLAALLSSIASLVIDKHSFYEQLKKTYVKETVTN